MKRRFRRDAKGRFKKRRKIPNIIQVVIDLLTCSYWAKTGSKINRKEYHLRTFDYNTDLSKYLGLLYK